ncbi:hypothetical protein TVAG_161690 [Trichomonas vaginalis G3]|uniref:NPHP4 Ig-like domain-containing protein n=1 Tax=Trichomonas vaginalis (strain ATCC PRA-98 / G3) TaxID=412133 RepID=A2EUP2_TRIV3|nr:nephrocystin-4 family [Trichomonas vaginalis G3]EAY03630.1 hypothetical protein TVAG_161690 [Trichomonas vaginalis G3]KAI5524725.1 nephrocystin-4 family [Trichomonas vaginalis G3]|eukprot:XP_001315853.1 hypothetical protein [Trichomonas vaginalis G3]
MDKTVANWLKEFQENYPLPPPDGEAEATGWTLTIQELQDFSLSRELQSVPDTTTYGMKIYVSVFNTKTGLFHGRTWSSPLLTNTSTSVINLTTHGLLYGKECLIIIEFSFVIRYFSNETSEKSLFFTVLYPFSSSQHICPLFTGSPRFLLQNPKDFAQFLNNRPGQLLIELQQNNDLLRAKQFIPLCSFMQYPPPGVIKLAPLSLNNIFPINISDISLVVDPNFEMRVKQGFEQLFSKKYKVPAEDLLLRANKYIIQIVAHNGYTQLQEPYRIELQPKSYWKYDGQLTFKNFVNDNRFALLFLFIINIEFNAEGFNKPDSTNQYPKKQLLEIPIGYSITIPTKDQTVTLKWFQEARLCPLCSRVCRVVENLPPLTYDVNYSPISGKANDINNLPVEFKTIIGADGGSLSPFDPINSAVTPLLAEELLDKLNGNHIRIMIKFLVARPDFTERFPISSFPKVYFEADVWQTTTTRIPDCDMEILDENIYCFDEKQSKDGKKGTMLNLDFKLPTVDHVTNYFLLMKSNELQVQMKDEASNMVIGRFTIPSSALLRQRKQSLQFPAYSNIISDDGEHLGMIYFVCGNFGTNEGEIDKNLFEQRNRIENGLIVAESMMKTDQEFRELVLKSMQEPLELAMKYRDGKRKQIILNDMQKRFLRTKKIFPVPGVEFKFTFESNFDPSENMDIRISIDDERIRFLGLTKHDSPIDDLESRYIPLRNTDMKLIQSQNLSTLEIFSLIHYGSDTISVVEGQKISLDFSFFTVQSITNKEITVTLLDKDNEVCDIFTVKIIASGDVAHETITKYIKKGSCLTATLSTSLSLKDAISANDLITAENSTSGVRLSSSPIDEDITTLVFMFGEDGSLVKVCKVIILLTPSEVLTAGSRLKVVLKHIIGNTIICRSNNSRIAQFTSHLTPTVLSPPGEVTAIAINGGTALLTIFDLTNKQLIRNIVVSIGAGRGDAEQKCLDKIQINLPVSTLVKRAVVYKNNTNSTKHVTLTTSHPDLVTFDPLSYDISPGETTRFKIHFLPHGKAESVALYVFLQERRSNKRAQEYYRFAIKYE